MLVVVCYCDDVVVDGIFVRLCCGVEIFMSNHGKLHRAGSTSVACFLAVLVHSFLKFCDNNLNFFLNLTTMPHGVLCHSH